MTNDELKQFAEEVANNYPGSEFVRTFAKEVLRRLAADWQQSERIATLERERDEARAAFLTLRDMVSDSPLCASDIEELRDNIRIDLEHNPDRPEWRKGDA